MLTSCAGSKLDVINGLELLVFCCRWAVSVGGGAGRVARPLQVYGFVAPRDARLGPFTNSEALAAEGAISRWIAVFLACPYFLPRQRCRLVS
jgi:hypothetical protein